MSVHKILEINNISEASYILRFTRNNMNFRPGQHLVVAFPGTGKAREYSIYNGIEDKDLAILVREVITGKVSSMLRNLIPGDKIEIQGPFGYFLSNIIPPEDRQLIFIASGTGIAPFHSFIKSFPDSDYRLIHGIKTLADACDINDYRKDRYIACTSRYPDGNFYGRLTGYLEKADIQKDAMIFFCGNNNMIQDAIEILRKKGFSQSGMFSEVYF